jgi:hypothetical protein
MQQEMDALIEEYWRLQCRFPSASSGAQMVIIHSRLPSIEKALLERIGAEWLDQLRRAVKSVLELNRWPRTTVNG